VINTLVEGKIKSGNFIVTATDPAGPWSEPHWLESQGLDPSLFFDDDGCVWYTGTRLKANGNYEGHTEIFLQELDLSSMRLSGEEHILWDGAVKGAVWAEAPHIYKVEGRYYLLIAEGGTAHHHAVTVARSNAITGPYESNRGNPVLTHRHLGLDYPIVGTGHADLVETQTGEWWAVLLALWAEKRSWPLCAGKMAGPCSAREPGGLSLRIPCRIYPKRPGLLGLPVIISIPFHWHTTGIFCARRVMNFIA
jgi:alpha-N-arabinofuranosidase